MVRKQSYQPNIDAGIGLIYRLNSLWNQVDYAALSGDFEKWNFVLDRIYCNLLYRNNLDVTYTTDEMGKPKEIQRVGLLKEDIMIFNKFRNIIRAIKLKRMEAVKKKNRTDYNFQSEELYSTLMLKDIWLRKFMQDNGLYLKEVEFNPANAMWGG